MIRAFFFNVVSFVTFLRASSQCVAIHALN